MSLRLEPPGESGLVFLLAYFDSRYAHMELQRLAIEMRLIPYIPDDRIGKGE